MYSRINTCELLMNSLVKVETGNTCNGFVDGVDIGSISDA